jgi:hypothetical protein
MFLFRNRDYVLEEPKLQLMVDTHYTLQRLSMMAGTRNAGDSLLGQSPIRNNGLGGDFSGKKLEK